ncbi:M48 family metallopeptidase [Methylocaldum sp. MU1018]
MVRHFLAILVAIQFAVGIGGCSTNPITGRSQVMLVSDAEAARASEQAYSQVLANAEKQRVLDDDPAVLDRVRSIAQPLIAQATALRPETRNWQWEVHVLKSGEVNAWCMAGGKIAVYTGLLQKIRPTDDELAQVLAHEIAHALLSHQAEKMSRMEAQKLGLGLGVLAGAVAGYDLSGVAGLADALATVGLQLPNSRKAENEADSVGIELAAKAGYDPFAAISLWEKMIKVGGSGGPDWLSTHPDPEQRLQSMRARAQQLMPVYEANRRTH